MHGWNVVEVIAYLCSQSRCNIIATVSRLVFQSLACRVRRVVKPTRTRSTAFARAKPNVLPSLSQVFTLPNRTIHTRTCVRYGIDPFSVVLISTFNRVRYSTGAMFYSHEGKRALLACTIKQHRLTVVVLTSRKYGVATVSTPRVVVGLLLLMLSPGVLN
jgi:hypothetical protein